MDCVSDERPDTDPQPDQIEAMLRVCRTCWLTMAQLRAILATIEQDPKCLGEPTTMQLLRHCRDELERHHRDTSHVPTSEIARAVLEASERRQKKQGE